jgi:hypothetical protein
MRVNVELLARACVYISRSATATSASKCMCSQRRSAGHHACWSWHIQLVCCCCSQQRCALPTCGCVVALGGGGGITCSSSTSAAGSGGVGTTFSATSAAANCRCALKHWASSSQAGLQRGEACKQKAEHLR